jgi:hypothetical protein
MTCSEKLESTFLQFNIEVILSKSFKNKTMITFVFFIKDGIGQYIITDRDKPMGGSIFMAVGTNKVR